MARKGCNDEDILKSLRKIEVHFHGGMNVTSACRTAGISDKTYYRWWKRYGGIGRAKLSEFKALKKEKHRLKRYWESLNWIS
jgi:putative transposase